MGYEAAEDAKEKLWPLCREIHDLHWQCIQEKVMRLRLKRSYMEMEQDLGPKILKAPDAFLSAARHLEMSVESSQRVSGGKKTAKMLQERSAVKAQICYEFWRQRRSEYSDNRTSVHYELMEQWDDLLDNYNFSCECPEYQTFCDYLKKYPESSVQR